MKKLCVGIMMSAMGFSTLATAEETGKWYLNPAIGYQVFDSSRDLEETVTALLGVEKVISPDWGVEFRLNYAEPDNYRDIPARDAEVSAASLDLLRYFGGEGSKFTPYAAFGVGHADVNYETGATDDGTRLNAGAGIRYALSSHWSLRGDLRYIYVTDHHTRDGLASIGLSYGFGGSEPEPVMAPADDDGDGVPNDTDRCPSTPAGVSVNAYGCALDSDGDGVPNYLDKCPNTPAGRKVDANGCEIVADAPGSLKVEINFAFDSDVIRPEYRDELSAVADFLKKAPNVGAVIEGHADSTGESTYNQNLSERRANAVRNALIKDHGIPANRLTAVGYGETRPVASNDTAAGRKANRRVITVRADGGN